jgi:type IX secretion system PorP/SprF family membrane protein
MRKKKPLLLLGMIILVCLPVVSPAQDVSFSQFFASPLYMNPAFSGSLGVSRMSLQYRNQWQGFGNAFSTYNLGFDIPVEKLQGGLGFFIMNDAQAAGSYQSLQLNMAYSVFLQIGHSFRLHGAIQAGIHQHALRTDKLIFRDNLDPYLGNHGISGEMEYLTDLRHVYPDFSAGLLLYSRQHFGGVAVHHLFEPERGFITGIDEKNKLPVKLTAHFGSRMPVYLYGHHRKKFDVSPQLVAQLQDRFGQMNYGLFATRYGMTTGAWFRQNFGLRYDAIILMAGFAKDQWQINYSYDIVVSGLWGHTGGSSEISLIFLLKKIGRESHLPFYNIYEDGAGFH